MAKIVTANLTLSYGGLPLDIPCQTKELSETESFYVNPYPVATASTDSAITLGSVAAADVFYIYSDYAISYKLNGSATAHTLDAGCYHLLMGDNVTALTVTNASGSTANLVIFAAGA